MQIGTMVYWVSNGRICKGEVIAINARKHFNGKPYQIVVEYDEKFHIRTYENSWDSWYETPIEAYRAGVGEVNRKALDCTQAMSNLMEDVAKLTDPQKEPI